MPRPLNQDAPCVWDLPPERAIEKRRSESTFSLSCKEKLSISLQEEPNLALHTGAVRAVSPNAINRNNGLKLPQCWQRLGPPSNVYSQAADTSGLGSPQAIIHHKAAHRYSTPLPLSNDSDSIPCLGLTWNRSKAQQAAFQNFKNVLLHPSSQDEKAKMLFGEMLRTHHYHDDTIKTYEKALFYLLGVRHLPALRTFLSAHENHKTAVASFNSRIDHYHKNSLNMHIQSACTVNFLKILFSKIAEVYFLNSFTPLNRSNNYHPKSAHNTVVHATPITLAVRHALHEFLSHLEGEASKSPSSAHASALASLKIQWPSESPEIKQDPLQLEQQGGGEQAKLNDGLIAEPLNVGPLSVEPLRVGPLNVEPFSATLSKPIPPLNSLQPWESDELSILINPPHSPFELKRHLSDSYLAQHFI